MIDDHRLKNLGGFLVKRSPALQPAGLILNRPPMNVVAMLRCSEILPASKVLHLDWCVRVIALRISLAIPRAPLRNALQHLGLEPRYRP